MAMASASNPYDPASWIIKIDATLEGIEPAISRALEVSRGSNLAELHELLQAAFDWDGTHLHQFEIGGLTYGAPEFDEGYEGDRKTFEATDVRLSDFSFRHDQPIEFMYEDDFGDSWRHRICLSLVPREDGVHYPRCTGGTRSAPPEDAGGPYSYADLVEAWRNPAHEEHVAVRKWTDRRFDPERFDLDVTNKAITSAMRKSKGTYRHRHLKR
ncbi:plasmid pRiA4b ORF-3 family protein [Sphingomonas rubra]|uniref:PRiA4b ORF-3-like protein n=1 Tax=Sphingomonas rubra TaxID=634430 RepID=A0A1I5TCG9_9SPHN|nr:plasmid pRiA4b ORF-3 family protein [Sphingomonas rubra]SFP80722.1 pRiA4b ORF-3-like protein [Sphingomonas rubra]